jgi:hypothetical protein
MAISLMVMASGPFFEIKIGLALYDIFDLDDELIVLDGAMQRCRIASAFDFVDQHGRKAAAAVAADHFVALLIIALSGRPADIAGVERRPDDAVGAFEHKIANGQAIGRVVEVTGFAVGKHADRITDITGPWCLRAHCGTGLRAALTEIGNEVAGSYGRGKKGDPQYQDDGVDGTFILMQNGILFRLVSAFGRFFHDE